MMDPDLDLPMASNLHLVPEEDLQAQVLDPTDQDPLTILEAAAVLVEVVVDGVEAVMVAEEVVEALMAVEEVAAVLMALHQAKVRYYFFAF